MVKVLSENTINKEDELVLTEEDKNNNFVLSCNAKPLSDLELDIEDLGEITLFEKKVIPSKISAIEKLTVAHNEFKEVDFKTLKIII